MGACQPRMNHRFAMLLYLPQTWNANCPLVSPSIATGTPGEPKMNELWLRTKPVASSSISNCAITSFVEEYLCKRVEKSIAPHSNETSAPLSRSSERLIRCSALVNPSSLSIDLEHVPLIAGDVNAAYCLRFPIHLFILVPFCYLL